MSSPPSSRVTFTQVSRESSESLTVGDFEDIDYFLHPRNTALFKQVIRNLHLACFWYSAPDMGAEACIRRSRIHLVENETLTDDAKAALAGAILHLERAVSTPGWQEWMTNGVSIPFEVEATFPLALRQAWSDSMDDNPDAIDANSLQLLRDANTNGTDMHDLHIAGWDSRANKWPDFFEEMEKVEKRVKVAEKKKAEAVKTEQAAAANAPTAVPKASPKKKAPLKKTKKDVVDEQLEQALRNSALQSSLSRSDLPRSLPTVIHTKSRSAKVNYVIDSILHASPADKFVIFGDIYELGHLREALDLFDIKL